MKSLLIRMVIIYLLLSIRYTECMNEKFSKSQNQAKRKQAIVIKKCNDNEQRNFQQRWQDIQIATEKMKTIIVDSCEKIKSKHLSLRPSELLVLIKDIIIKRDNSGLLEMNVIRELFIDNKGKQVDRDFMHEYQRTGDIFKTWNWFKGYFKRDLDSSVEKFRNHIIQEDIECLQVYFTCAFDKVKNDDSTIMLPSDMLKILRNNTVMGNMIPLQYKSLQAYIRELIKEEQDEYFDEEFFKQYSMTGDKGKTWDWFKGYFKLQLGKSIERLYGYVVNNQQTHNICKDVARYDAMRLEAYFIALIRKAKKDIELKSQDDLLCLMPSRLLKGLQLYQSQADKIAQLKHMSLIDYLSELITEEQYEDFDIKFIQKYTENYDVFAAWDWFGNYFKEEILVKELKAFWQKKGVNLVEKKSSLKDSMYIAQEKMNCKKNVKMFEAEEDIKKIEENFKEYCKKQEKKFEQYRFQK